MQEVSFWRNLSTALQALKKQRDSPAVALTLAILQHGRRFQATMRLAVADCLYSSSHNLKKSLSR